MDIVTIDFETYYDREFSLSKMTTEAYIRDDRFEVIFDKPCRAVTPGQAVVLYDGDTVLGGGWIDDSQE